MEKENSDSLRVRLMEVVSLCAEYCFICQNAGEMDKEGFVDRMLNVLPRVYWQFFDIDCDLVSLGEFDYFSSYVDEDYYESIRHQIERIMGEDDMYLETFEEDMKYSEQPIPSSIAEALADIFQPLFNFISIVKDSEGEKLTDAFLNCKEDFQSYWSQTLCNVLRALNYVRYNSSNMI